MIMWSARPLPILLWFALAGTGVAGAAESQAPEDLVFSPEVESILNEASGPEGYGALERCIPVRSIRGSEVLDDQHVVFELPSKTYYLVQFQYKCHQLRRNSAIAYEPRGSQLCRMDDIRAMDGFAPGSVGPPCPIPGFYEVTGDQVALLRETLKAERQAVIDAYKAEKAKRKAEKQAEKQAQEQTERSDG